GRRRRGVPGPRPSGRARPGGEEEDHVSETVARERVLEAAAGILSALDQAVLGQRSAAEALVCAYMAGGHALLEGVPGVGKTLLARSFAACVGLRFARVQFTPDLMPTDVIGMNVMDGASKTFRLVRGPVFTQVLMADEINRTPPKTQAALLEAMQERQVTIDGQSHPLEPEFFVMATENPVEFEGTYPLPEAQLDRFLLRIEMRLPDEAAAIEGYRRPAAAGLGAGGGGRERRGSARAPRSVPARPRGPGSPALSRAPGRARARLAPRGPRREPAGRAVPARDRARGRARRRPRLRPARRHQALPP